MYCYTYLTGLECGLRELALWSEISSEHPIFLQSVAGCLNLPLSPSIVAGLNRINQCMKAVNQEALRLLSMAGYHRDKMMHSPLVQETARLMQQFLQYDQEFLGILQQLKMIGRDQPVWQMLVTHIEQEQIYMYNLIYTLMQQLFQMPPHQPGVYGPPYQTTP